MRIRTRILLGLTILLAVMFSGLLYHTYLVSELSGLAQDLSTTEAVLIQRGLLIDRQIGQIRELSAKYTITQDRDYLREVDRLARRVDTLVTELQSRALAPRNVDVAALAQTWRPLRENLLSLETTTEVETETLSNAEAAVTSFERELQEVLEASQEALRQGSLAAAEISSRGDLIAGGVTALSVLIATVLAFVLTGSISAPIARLSGAARRLGAGNLSLRLKVEGDDEIADLTRSFNHMAGRLEELDQLKEAFISHVSHELKAPLASVQETTRVLLDELPGTLNRKQRTFLEMNLASEQRLHRMIGNLLDLSTIEAGVMDYRFSRADMAALVRSVVREYAPLCNQQQIHCDIQLPEEQLPVRCDSDRITQVLGNLLANAIQFSPPGGTVCILTEKTRSSQAEAQRSYLKVSVADRGPGVPSELRVKIFEPFFTASQGVNRSKGTGLGLAISREIAVAHGGDIQVEDNDGGGSVFYLMIPEEGRE